MPRKLLRVALIAAVIPALTPVMSSAQIGKPGSTVRTAASTPAPKQTSPSWWQRLRGQKPAASSMAKVVKVSAERSASAAAANADNPFDLEGNSDVQLLRSRSNRVRPSISEQPAAEQISPAQPSQSAVAAPVVESASEPAAFPINSAPPPQDVTAEYNSPRGDVPRYDHTGMRFQDTPANDVEFANPVPARPVARAMDGMGSATPAPVVVGPPPGFVRVDGAMYPSPQQGIPLDVGSTMITNPAFDPHEMLHAHRYRGLYGPFYHKTHRSWVLTPFGIYKSEKRILMGTEVRVNYKSHISPFSLFFPPVTH